MSDLNKLKELRNALACWQEDYDPTEDKEQFDMFGDAVDAVARLVSAERRIAEQDAVIAQRNAECDRLIIEKGLACIQAAAVVPPEMSPGDIRERWPGMNVIESHASALVWNQCRADVIALSCQPQKVVELENVESEAIFNAWDYRNMVINALDAAGVQWEESK